MAVPARVVLVEYLAHRDEMLAFIVRSDFDEPEVAKIAVSAEEIRRFAEAKLGVLGARSNIHNLEVNDWQEVAGPLVEPVRRWANEGDIIWMVPHDVLHYLPLHALAIDGQCLIERNPVCYTPSASVMKYCHLKRKKRGDRALVLGDSRDDLRFAREEATVVAELFQVPAHLGREATKNLVKSRIETDGQNLDILHFACHGYFNADQPLKSGIVLAPEEAEETDGTRGRHWNLTAEEILAFRMRVNLVTVSGCATGVNQRNPGDELIGLTRALLYAGTPSVVVSLWVVNDLSAGLLMQRFYEAMRNPTEEKDGSQVTKAEALQQAQVYVKNLTAGQVVDHCRARAAALTGAADVERRVHFQLAEAQVRAMVGDAPLAINLCRGVQAQLGSLRSEQAGELGALAEQSLVSLSDTVRDLAPASADYSRKPFQHPFHWAPFILVGDWK